MSQYYQPYKALPANAINLLEDVCANLASSLDEESPVVMDSDSGLIEIEGTSKELLLTEDHVIGYCNSKFSQMDDKSKQKPFIFKISALSGFIKSLAAVINQTFQRIFGSLAIFISKKANKFSRFNKNFI